MTQYAHALVPYVAHQSRAVDKLEHQPGSQFRLLRRLFVFERNHMIEIHGDAVRETPLIECPGRSAAPALARKTLAQSR